tara:strand:+ start:269 stop:439 length:171 start_codon:yes stop_codon:yes gene_type:complete
MLVAVAMINFWLLFCRQPVVNATNIVISAMGRNQQSRITKDYNFCGFLIVEPFAIN